MLGLYSTTQILSELLRLKEGSVGKLLDSVIILVRDSVFDTVPIEII